MTFDKPIESDRGPLPVSVSSEAIDFHAVAVRLQRFFHLLPICFQSGEFGDAALLILLDLFVAAQQRRRLSIKSLSIGSGVPHSTALRYIERLEGAGLIKRQAHPLDRRSAHMSLAPAAAEILASLLSQLFAA